MSAGGAREGGRVVEWEWREGSECSRQKDS